MEFFTSDQHFGHANIIALVGRPFQSVQEMNATIVERFNAVVTPEDTVFHLGDFCFRTTISGVTQMLGQLNGRHILVAGNHDPCSTVHSRWQREVRRYIEAGFTEVHQELVREVAGLGVVQMNHFPLFEQSDEDTHLRYTEHRPRVLAESARIQLCGHVHERWRVRGRSVNVGVDVWDYAPTTADMITRHIDVT